MRQYVAINLLPTYKTEKISTQDIKGHSSSSKNGPAILYYNCLKLKYYHTFLEVRKTIH